MRRINWGWRIVIANIIFIAGTASWVGYALTKDVDLVEGDYYEQSLKHDETMAARARAHALHGSASITFDPIRDSFVVRIPPEQAGSAYGSISLYRPNSSREDRRFPLSPSADGSMLIPASGLNRGIWKVTADWSSGGKRYELLATRTI